jgi:hypothetical protein
MGKIPTHTHAENVESRALEGELGSHGLLLLDPSSWRRRLLLLGSHILFAGEQKNQSFSDVGEDDAHTHIHIYVVISRASNRKKKLQNQNQKQNQKQKQKQNQKQDQKPYPLSGSRKIRDFPMWARTMYIHTYIYMWSF